MEGIEMIVHFYSSFTPKDPGTLERQRVAKVTWAAQPWTELPIEDAKLPRLWKEEGRAYPYVKDLFDYALTSTLASDAVNPILVYTNADVCVRSDCALFVACVMQETDAFYSMRRDFNHDFHEPISDEGILKGDAYVGSDFYAFRLSWWRRHREDFPDLLIACEGWDAVLRHMIEFTNPNRQVSVPNLTYHRRHASFWENPANRHRLRCQLYNISLCITWMRKNRIDPARHGLMARQ